MKNLITWYLNQVMLLEALSRLEPSSMNELMRGRYTERVQESLSENSLWRSRSPETSVS
ncbi:hypothetical protein J2129_000015 [Methanofollis sp. W23]|nr:hypothetical protein [Methanofollis sp. W23]